jgi:hypothetical protein
METYIHWSPKPALPENAPPSSRLSCQRSWEKSTREGKATRGPRGSYSLGTSITRSIVRAHRKGGTTSLASRRWARTASRLKGVLVRRQRCPRNERGRHLGAKPDRERAKPDPGFPALVVRSRRSRSLGGAARAGGIALT